MNDVKSILISMEIHEKMKKFSQRTGMKIKFITEKAIENFIEERIKNMENSNG